MFLKPSWEKDNKWTTDASALEEWFMSVLWLQRTACPHSLGANYLLLDIWGDPSSSLAGWRRVAACALSGWVADRFSIPPLSSPDWAVPQAAA